jgi:hypothetical protein
MPFRSIGYYLKRAVAGCRTVPPYPSDLCRPAFVYSGSAANRNPPCLQPEWHALRF